MECTVSIVILKPSWCKKPQQQIEHTAAAPSKEKGNKHQSYNQRIDVEILGSSCRSTTTEISYPYALSFIHFGNNACQFFLHLTECDPLLDKDEDGVVAGHGAQNGAATAAVDVARQTDGIALTGLDDPHIA